MKSFRRKMDKEKLEIQTKRQKAAERVRKWREKLKENPEKFEEYKKKESLRVQAAKSVTAKNQNANKKDSQQTNKSVDASPQVDKIDLASNNIWIQLSIIF